MRVFTDLQQNYINACPADFEGSTNEKLVYGKLILKSQEAIKNGKVTFTIGKIDIANEIGISDRTIGKILNKFIEDGNLIRTEIGSFGKNSVYKVIDCTTPTRNPSLSPIEDEGGVIDQSTVENLTESKFEAKESTSNNNSNTVINSTSTKMENKMETDELKALASVVETMGQSIQTLEESNKSLNERLDKAAKVIKEFKVEINDLKIEINSLKGGSTVSLPKVENTDSKFMTGIISSNVEEANRKIADVQAADIFSKEFKDNFEPIDYYSKGALKERYKAEFKKCKTREEADQMYEMFKAQLPERKFIALLVEAYNLRKSMIKGQELLDRKATESKASTIDQPTVESPVESKLEAKEEVNEENDKGIDISSILNEGVTPKIVIEKELSRDEIKSKFNSCSSEAEVTALYRELSKSKSGATHFDYVVECFKSSSAKFGGFVSETPAVQEEEIDEAEKAEIEYYLNDSNRLVEEILGPVEEEDGTTNQTEEENLTESETEGKDDGIIPESEIEMVIDEEFNLCETLNEVEECHQKLVHRLPSSKYLDLLRTKYGKRYNEVKSKSYKPFNCDEKLANTQKPYLYSPN